MRPTQRLVCRLIFVLLCLGLVARASADQEQGEAGRLLKMKGQAEVAPAGGRVWLAPRLGQAFFDGDTVKTGDNGQLALLLADETLIQLNRNSLFIFQTVPPAAGWNPLGRLQPAAAKAPQSTYKVDKGELWLLNKNRGVDIDVETPAMSAALRGTECTILVGDDGLVTVRMQEGFVQLANAQGTLVIGSGEEAFARPGEAPRKRMLLEPENAVQWTILLPSWQDLQQAEGDQSWQEALPLLDVGELDKARALLEAMAAGQRDSAPLRQLLAIIALAKGDGEAALAQAARASELAPQAAMPWVIKAYAQQAGFALEQALAAVKQALALEPNQVTALVVLARLQFGLGRPKEATAAIERALALDPRHGEANILLGFIQLARRASQEAEGAFRKAIAADCSRAEPHLGLGLLAMRQGWAETALKEISSAVLLEPRRSLFRSYWAKMLYQMNRHQKALDVLAISQRLDPRDPTPDLYRALIYRDLRMPGEAIASLNEAVRKNDQRAVYRSRYLLDRDLAVKNIDLSLLYDQLGLLAWAKNKATASLYEDYTNASAHMFYAGALSSGDGRSWSRNTATLLSRLLIPANANTFNSFNDYTTFFERPAFEADYSGTVGSQGTINHALTAFGALPAANLAYSLGYLPAETEGWRPGYFNHSRYLVAYGKWDPTPDQGLMVSGERDAKAQGGKYAPRYEYDDPPETNDSQESEVERFEVGYHLAVQPGTDLLLHAAKGRSSDWMVDYRCLMPGAECSPAGRLELFERYRLSQDFLLLQGELIHRHGRHQWIVGGAQHRQDGGLQYSWLLENDPPAWSFDSGPMFFDGGQELTEVYGHDIWRIGSDLVLDSALYADRLQKSKEMSDLKWTIEAISPRLGLIWTPWAKHTFKAVAFKALLPLYGDTLAPADVAGVPVHRDGKPGAISKEADLAWDYELGQGLLANALFFYERRYGEPEGNGQMLETIVRGQGLRSVFETLVGERMGLALHYRFDRISDSDPLAKRDEHFVSAGLSWVHPLGLAAKVKESYRAIGFASPARGHEDILLTDLEFGYELPNKTGALGLAVNNLFDEHGNWLTDTLVSDGRVPAREAWITVKLLY